MNFILLSYVLITKLGEQINWIIIANSIMKFHMIGTMKKIIEEADILLFRFGWLGSGPTNYLGTPNSSWGELSCDNTIRPCWQIWMFFYFYFVVQAKFIKLNWPHNFSLVSTSLLHSEHTYFGILFFFFYTN